MSYIVDFILFVNGKKLSAKAHIQSLNKWCHFYNWEPATGFTPREVSFSDVLDLVFVGSLDGNIHIASHHYRTPCRVPVTYLCPLYLYVSTVRSSDTFYYDPVTIDLEE